MTERALDRTRLLFLIPFPFLLLFRRPHVAVDIFIGAVMPFYDLPAPEGREVSLYPDFATKIIVMCLHRV